jgi:hypothetical protein
MSEIEQRLDSYKSRSKFSIKIIFVYFVSKKGNREIRRK